MNISTGKGLTASNLLVEVPTSLSENAPLGNTN
jgi:hypothetical protein